MKNGVSHFAYSSDQHLHQDDRDQVIMYLSIEHPEVAAKIHDVPLSAHGVINLDRLARMGTNAG